MSKIMNNPGLLSQTVHASKDQLNPVRRLGAGALALGVLLSSSLLPFPGVALQPNTEQTFFDRPPRLIRTATSVTQTEVSGATYHFTLKVPQDAGESLKSVTIVQYENPDTVVFQEDKNRAFAGDSFAGGPQVALASVGGPQPSGTNEETVVFDSPVTPGSTVTVTLKPKRNPDRAGVYLFGVTAYPVGESSPGQFLGYGRLHFYDNQR